MDNFEVIDEIIKKTKEEINQLPPVNILLIGKTGVGKSTLINAFFREKLAETGIGKPVTESLIKISKEDLPINIYDTQGLELNPGTQKKVLNEIIRFINKQNHKKIKDHIHLVYYCINSTGGRIEEYEINIIHSIGKEVPVILILTQDIGENSTKLLEYIKQIDLQVVGMVPLLAKDYILHKDFKIEAHGLQELLEISIKNLPEELFHSFNNAQFVDVNKKVKAARRWAKKYIYATFGVGFVPIPFSDASLLVPMQITMLAHISAIFGLNMDRQKLTAILAGLGGTTGTTYVGRTIVSNAIKFIPGAGSVVGGLISGATASALTTALVNSYIEILKIITIREQRGHEIDFREIEDLMNKFFTKQNKNRG